MTCDTDTEVAHIHHDFGQIVIFGLYLTDFMFYVAGQRATEYLNSEGRQGVRVDVHTDSHGWITVGNFDCAPGWYVSAAAPTNPEAPFDGLWQQLGDVMEKDQKRKDSEKDSSPQNKVLFPKFTPKNGDDDDEPEPPRAS